jgi:hypothetical protein
MSKRQWLCIFGVWVMFFLFLGFPAAWHKIIAIVSGIIIIAIAYSLPQEQATIHSGLDSTFIENEKMDNTQNQ